jgi:hypothetical protein
LVETGGLVLRSDGSAGPPEIGEQEPAGSLRVGPELIPHINDARINPYAAEPVTEVVQHPSSPILEDVANEKHVFRGLDKLSSQGKALTADWRSAFPNIKGQQEIEFNRILIGIFQTIQHSVENVILVLSLVPGGGTAKVIAYKLSGEEISNTEVALSLVGDLFEVAAVRNLLFAPRGSRIPTRVSEQVLRSTSEVFSERIGRNVLSERTIERLKTRLSRNGVDLITGSEADDYIKTVRERPGQVYVDITAIFRADTDSSAKMYIRSGATRNDVMHELRHYMHWLEDPDAFLQMTGEIGRLKKELYVLESLRQSNHWLGKGPKAWTSQERISANLYINKIKMIVRLIEKGAP